MSEEVNLPDYVGELVKRYSGENSSQEVLVFVREALAKIDKSKKHLDIQEKALQAMGRVLIDSLKEAQGCTRQLLER